MALVPVIVQEIARISVAVSKQGTPVVLVVQNAELALQFANFAYVLETENVSLEGPASELHESEHIRRANLSGREQWSLSTISAPASRMMEACEPDKISYTFTHRVAILTNRPSIIQQKQSGKSNLQFHTNPSLSATALLVGKRLRCPRQAHLPRGSRFTEATRA